MWEDLREITSPLHVHFTHFGGRICKISVNWYTTQKYVTLHEIVFFQWQSFFSNTNLMTKCTATAATFLRT
jgi:hypothetical protein